MRRYVLLDGATKAEWSCDESGGAVLDVPMLYETTNDIHLGHSSVYFRR